MASDITRAARGVAEPRGGGAAGRASRVGGEGPAGAKQRAAVVPPAGVARVKRRPRLRRGTGAMPKPPNAVGVPEILAAATAAALKEAGERGEPCEAGGEGERELAEEREAEREPPYQSPPAGEYCLGSAPALPRLTQLMRLARPRRTAVTSFLRARFSWRNTSASCSRQSASSSKSCSKRRSFSERVKGNSHGLAPGRSTSLLARGGSSSTASSSSAAKLRTASDGPGGTGDVTAIGPGMARPTRLAMRR